MTITVSEAYARERVELRGGRVTAARVFYVTGTGAHGSEITEATALSQNGVPIRGETHPRFNTLVANEYEVLPLVEDENGIGYAITWIYTDILYAPPPGGGEDPGTPGFTAFHWSAEAPFYDLWRVGGVTLPADLDTPVYGADDDIGGTPIDSQGEPQSEDILQMRADISEVVEASVALLQAKLSVVAFLTNKRNDAFFLGAAIGKLLLKGADCVRIGHTVYNITYHFAWDEFYHLRQHVLLHPNGKPRLGTGAYEGHGFPVQFVQPYPLKGSFAALGITL